jgi:hypothetical protein
MRSRLSIVGTIFSLIAMGLLVTILTASRPAIPSAGCRAFRGAVDHHTKGEGGNRVGHGFSKGDTLTVTIHQAPSQAKEDVNLLEYVSPGGPFRAITEDTSESFTYTVPANTGDFIYLNLSGARQGMTVAWGWRRSQKWIVVVGLFGPLPFKKPGEPVFQDRHGILQHT